MERSNNDHRTVAESMAHAVSAIRIDSTLSEADLDQIVPDEGRFVTVVSPHRRVLGLASFEDLRAAVAAGGGSASPRAVILLGVPLLRADAPTSDAIEQLRASRVDVLPVVDEERRLIGTISADQLALRGEHDFVDLDAEDFDGVLDALERDADVGLVPGELARWCSVVAARLAEVYALWPRRQRDRRDVIACIREHDAALHARADDLEQTEAELGRRLDSLCLLVRRSATAEQSLRRREVSETRSLILYWVADVRAHDGDLTTWYNEAMLRERGVGD